MWFDYSFSFTRFTNQGKLCKWVQVLKSLSRLESKTKREIFNEIDPIGYNKGNICQRGWNSHLFSAMARKGLIKYNKSTKKWMITTYGSRFFFTKVPYGLRRTRGGIRYE